MNKNIKEALNLFLILTITVSSVAIFSFSNFDSLKGLLYPKKIDFTAKEGDDYGNTLQVASFINANGESYSFEEREITIDQIDSSLDSQPASGMGGTTPYSITLKEDMENVILQAPSSNFIGWSGCDATTDVRCQISVTDHQTRKVEAHYSVPEPDLPLQLWSVSNNNLGGSFNEDFFQLINPLIALKAANNNISGSLPSTIGDLDSLQISLGRNLISGSIPADIGDLSSIEYLALHRNDLSGSIPADIGDLTSLKYLLLYNNKLSGSIPADIGDLTSLKRLELHNNKLSGSVPADLANLKSLTPDELRLYNNKLTGAETGLVSKSNWDGINFNSNKFNVSASMSVLQDASSRSGSYIDFCSNPTNGGTIYYDLEGEIKSTSIKDEVNAALAAGWDVYIPIELRQQYEVYTHWRGGPTCKGSGCCTEVCTTNSDGEEECSCKDCSTCEPPIVKGYDEPPPGSVDCARLTDPIYSPSDVDPNSTGIPAKGKQGLRHVYHYNSCKWWVGPGKECEPVCEYDVSCGSPSGCPVNSFECYHTGEFNFVNEPGNPESDMPFRGTCSSVKTNY